MSKFTAGPWRADTDGYHIMKSSRAVAAVFGVNGHGQIPAETKANAHLIAAAPEMYAALRKVLGYLDYPGNGKPPDSAGAATVEVCLEEVRDALAKARGESDA